MWRVGWLDVKWVDEGNVPAGQDGWSEGAGGKSLESVGGGSSGGGCGGL